MMITIYTHGSKPSFFLISSKHYIFKFFFVILDFVYSAAAFSKTSPLMASEAAEVALT